MVLGEEAAKNIYKQDKRSTVSNKVQAIYHELFQRTKSTLETQEWITQKLIAGNSKPEKVNQCWARILEDFNLAEVIINAPYRELYNITQDMVGRNSKIAVRR